MYSIYSIIICALALVMFTAIFVISILNARLRERAREKELRYLSLIICLHEKVNEKKRRDSYERTNTVNK